MSAEPAYNEAMGGTLVDRYLPTLRRHLPELARKYHVRSLEVFGSYVRNEQTPESDLDLLVTFETAPGLFEFIELGDRLSDLLDVKVDLVMKTALKPRLEERILREAIPV
jgi:predicted nucleotidyltransferase